MATIGKLNLMLSLSSRGFTSGLDAARRALGSFGVAVNATTGLTVGGTGLTGMMIGLADVTRQLGTNAVKTAADWESMAVSFGALTGSAELGEATLNKIANIAAVTPFQFKDMAASVQKMMATGFGTDESIDMLVKLGDVAAAAPQGMAEGLGRITLALSQMKGKGKVMSQEMNQLAEAGIPAWQTLAARMKVDVAEARHQVETGFVSGDTGIAAVLDLANDPKFAGMMDKQSRTLLGTFSTLKDNAQLAMRDFGRVLIDSMDLKGGVNQLSALLAQVRTGIETWKPSLTVAGGAFTALKDIAFVSLLNMIDGFKTLAGDGLNLEERVNAVRIATIDMAEQGALGMVGFVETLRDAFGWAGKLVRALGYIPGLISAGSDHLAWFMGEALGGMDMSPELGAGSRTSDWAKEQTDRLKALFAQVREFKGLAAQWQEGGMTGRFAGAAGAAGGFGFMAAMQATASAQWKDLGADLAGDFDLGFAGQLTSLMGLTGEKVGGIFSSSFSDMANAEMFEKTRTPLEAYEMQLEKINAMGLSAELRTRAIGMAFMDLEKAASLGADRLPEAMLAGSREAEAAINRHQSGQTKKDPVAVLEQMRELDKRQVEFLKEIAGKVAPPKIVKAK